MDPDRVRLAHLAPKPISVDELADDALDSLAPPWVRGRVRRELPYDLPLVEVDHVLMVQVFATCSTRGPPLPRGCAIRLGARRGRHRARLGDDCGPGIAPDEREQIFQKFNRVSGSGRAGLGLTIARRSSRPRQHIEVTTPRAKGPVSPSPCRRLPRAELA